MAISFRSVNSWKAASIVDTCVSKGIHKCEWSERNERGLYVLASTTRKFFFWCSLICPIPARRRPVIESYKREMVSTSDGLQLTCRPRLQWPQGGCGPWRSMFTLAWLTRWIFSIEHLQYLKTLSNILSIHLLDRATDHLPRRLQHVFKHLWIPCCLISFGTVTHLHSK